MITYFGAEHALETHGAQMTALHFMKGFRIGYFTLQPEQTANADVRLQSGQMPNLFVITKGRGVGHPAAPAAAARGAHLVRHKPCTNVVLLEPELARLFRDSTTVNEALRQ